MPILSELELFPLLVVPEPLPLLVLNVLLPELALLLMPPLLAVWPEPGRELPSLTLLLVDMPELGLMLSVLPSRLSSCNGLKLLMSDSLDGRRGKEPGLGVLGGSSPVAVATVL